MLRSDRPPSGPAPIPPETDASEGAPAPRHEAQDTLDHRHLAARVTVSVVIPTHNRSRWLPSAVRSACEQSVAGLEVIVVDDGSTDETPTVCAALAAADGRVRVVRQGNLGPTHARNAGIAAARGRWIAFLDDDDALTPDALSSLLAFAAATGSPVVAGRAATFAADDPVTATGILAEPSRFLLSAWPPGHPPSPRLVPEELVLRPQVAINCGLFSAETLEGLDGFEAAPGEPEDYDLWLRLSARQPIPVLDSTVALVRLHAKQRSGRLGPQAAATRAVLERFLAGHPEVAARAGRRAVAARLAHLCREEAYAALLDGRRHDAAHAALTGIRLRPAELKAWTYLALSPVPGVYRWLRNLSGSGPLGDRERGIDASPDPDLLGGHGQGGQNQR